MNHIDKRQGFTLIELMLSMAFLSVLLIAIAMTVIQIGSIYNRGLTLKDVNQAGGALASELQRTIANSSSFNVKVGEVGSQYIVQDWGGRLCLGQYSYIWNYGIDIVNKHPSRNVYSNSTNDIRFIKVTDSNSIYCTETAKKVDINNAVELLSAGEHDLAIHDFKINTEPTAGDNKTGQYLYSLDFVIGTNSQGALNYDDGIGKVSCKTPSEAGSDPNYCLINSFSVVARAGNTIQ